MDSISLLRKQSDSAFESLLETVEGVTEAQSWAVLPQGGPDYIHTDGSIHGIVLHVASCKVMYGSVGFRGTEVRWRDCADRIEQFEPNWQAALDYLKEAQEYWLASWASLKEEELEEMRQKPSGRVAPIWQIIHIQTDHDAWHGGQIAMLRYAVGESSVPPPSGAEDIRKYCVGEPSW